MSDKTKDDTISVQTIPEVPATPVGISISDAGRTHTDPLPTGGDDNKDFDLPPEPGNDTNP